MENYKLEDTYLYKYNESIKNGEIRAGYDIIMELNNLIEDYYDDQYIYDISDAYLRIDFIETFVKLTKDPFYGKPFILLLWQKALIEVAYSFKMKSIDNDEWVDRFQEILLIISRKCGKTELIAAIMVAELFIGDEGRDIVCSGTNDNIANICYEAVDKMRLLIDPKQVRSWKNQKGIKCLYNNNFIFKLSDSSRNKEGRNINIAGMDEIWAFLDDSMYKPIQQSAGTKESYKIFMFGSEGLIDGGFLDEKRAEYTSIIRNEDDSDSSKRKLPWIYSQDSEKEVWDTNENGINPDWEKANPSIGAVKKWSYLKDRVDEARRNSKDRIMVLSKDFNFKMNNSAAWLMNSDIDYEQVFDLEKFRGAICIGAVDLAKTTDMCSAKIMLMKSGDRTKYIYQMYWIPQNKLEDSDDKNEGAKYEEWNRQGLLRTVEENSVDPTIIAEWFLELYNYYDIRIFKVGYDQYNAKTFTDRMSDFNFECEMVKQNRETLTLPMKLLEKDLKTQIVNFNNNPIDRWCLLNTAVKIYDDEQMMPIKVKGKAGKRIDGAVTFIILYAILYKYRSEFMNSID